MRNRIFQYLKTGVAGLTLTAGILMLPIEAQALEQEQTPEITVKDEALGGALHGLAGEGTDGAAVSAQAETKASDLSSFTNTLEMLPVYGSTVNTYLEKTSGGWQTVLVGDAVHIVDFDQNWNQKSEKTLDYELPVFGAYYAGEKYNYLVYGQNGASAGTEIYRVVKYDKTFNRLAALSVPYEDCYTRIPFESGNVSVAENGNQLVVYTTRERPDGHQSNIALQINTDTMTISDDHGMSMFPDIHVSHSFREVVKFDGNDPVYVDLGDASPRAVCLQQQPGIYTNMLTVPGQDGDNDTDTDVSGLEVTDTGYLVVGSQMRNYCNNIYLSYAKKGETTAQVTWLTGSTTYNYSGAANAKIVKISDGKYAVMWNCYDSGGGVNYVMVNGQGQIISGLKKLQGAELTQCQPVFSGGSVNWLKYSGGERQVYTMTDFSCTGSYEIRDTYVEPVDSWDGTADTSWYSGGRTEFTLNTPAQLAGLAQLVNEGNSFEGKTISLGKDMFFNEADSTENAWTPIASEESGAEFQGTFEGQGHSLYNMYIPEGAGGGIFGVIGENGIVRGVKVSQGYIEESAAVATINNGWILFCENNSYISNYDDYAGGVCSENNNLVYGCGNTGVIEAGEDGGGVVGRSRETGASVDSCWNEGYVASGGGVAAGVIAENYGWVYDCYNSGTVSGSLWYNYAKTVGGVVGENHGSGSSEKHKVRNSYNAGHLDINEEWNYFCSDAVCGGNDQDSCNLYTTPSEYISMSGSEVVSVDELKSADMAERLQYGEAVAKWQAGTEEINSGLAIPVARADMEKGVYKMLPDVWNPVTEVDISISDSGYQLRAFRYAYYGLKMGTAVYSSDSDVLSVTEKGVITPKKAGTAVVHVTFPESDYAKEGGFDVTVHVSGTKGDVDGSGKVDIADLRMVLRKVCGKIQFTEAQVSIADVETDGKVDIADLRKILRFVCGKIETL